MLPGFIGQQLGDDRSSPTGLQRWLEGLGVGVALSASFSSMLVAAGVVLAAGARSPVDVMPWLVLVVAAALTIAGAKMIAGRIPRVRVPARLRPRSLPAGRYARVAVFGVGIDRVAVVHVRGRARGRRAGEGDVGPGPVRGGLRRVRRWREQRPVGALAHR